MARSCSQPVNRDAMQIGDPVVSGNSSRKLWPKFAGIRILALVSLDGQDRDINYWAKPRPVVSAEVLAIDQLELQAEVLTLQGRIKFLLQSPCIPVCRLLL